MGHTDIPVDEEVDLTTSLPLADDEDAALRRLHYMAQLGDLSESWQGRLTELRRRDRRQEIRTPREFEPDAPSV